MGYSALKLAATIFLFLIPVVKPFWVKFSEGLADLAVRVIELKAKRRWPGLSNGTYEIVAKQPEEDGADGSKGRAKDSPREIGAPGPASPLEQTPPDGARGDRQSSDGE
jgi:hypothetical protein